MKLEEAIKENQRTLTRSFTGVTAKSYDAARLGIEALKRLREARADLDPDEYYLLPGETKE